MLKIRFQRVGRKHEPSFRLVLTDSENSSKSGRFKEILGSYDPRKETDLIRNADRITYWLGQGAKPTGSVHNFLLKHKVITGSKVNVLPKKTVAKKEEPVVEAPKAEAAPETAPEAPAEQSESTEAPAAEEAPVVESTQAE